MFSKPKQVSSHLKTWKSSSKAGPGDAGKEGKELPQLQKTVMVLKALLRDTYHSVFHQQSYFDKYSNNRNGNEMKERS
jgi:hypothetical protein